MILLRVCLGIHGNDTHDFWMMITGKNRRQSEDLVCQKRLWALQGRPIILSWLIIAVKFFTSLGRLLDRAGSEDRLGRSV